MPRIPHPWYADGAWRTDFGGIRNRVLVRGSDDTDTRFQAEKELLRLREEAKLLQKLPAGDTPFAVVVDRFLANYVGRPAYQDFSNELHWFMGIDCAVESDRPAARGGNNRERGGRFGFACKSWPIRRINSEVVERYLRRRKEAGLSGYHAFVTLRTLMNWAVRKKYLLSHDIDQVELSLRRKGRRQYLPSDADVAHLFQAATGKFKDLLTVYTHTGIRPSELRTVTIDEFDRTNRQWVLRRHKVAHRTGQPKIVHLASAELMQLCVSSAGDRGGDQPLFLNHRGKDWTYNALRLRWYRLRNKLKLDRRFTLYCLRHWYVTKAVESGECEAFVAELAGHVGRESLDHYKKMRNGPLHQASQRVTATVAASIARGGIGPE